MKEEQLSELAVQIILELVDSATFSDVRTANLIVLNVLKKYFWRGD